VYGDAWVSGNAEVYGNVAVFRDAWVSGGVHAFSASTTNEDKPLLPKGKLVTPETYFVGATAANFDELFRYLKDTDQVEFMEAIADARQQGLSDGEILISYYAKLCYAALTTKKNENISRVRDIHDNLLGVIQSGHGSCWEHCYLNFTITNCSRVLTHELVRHRTGTSFSQSSGRYIRTDKLDLVIDPILAPINKEILELQSQLEHWYDAAVEKMGLDAAAMPFDKKKKITSALRRMLPNGQANEIGFGVNLRSLRNLLVLRTSRHAEWEIRLVFNQIRGLVRAKYPTLFEDEQLELIDGQLEITFSTDKL
jgi:thymidylate synthase (FAD)